MSAKGWIGVDLDGTLAYYDKWDEGRIGAPIPRMVERVRAWVKEGKDVRIFTARVYDPSPAVSMAIHEWCRAHLGFTLPITNVKDWAMIELWDDRAVQVIPNTGLRADCQDL